MKKLNTNQKIAIAAIITVFIIHILSQTVFTPVKVCLRDVEKAGYSKVEAEWHCIEQGLAR